jgi:hypothetical protein
MKLKRTLYHHAKTRDLSSKSWERVNARSREKSIFALQNVAKSCIFRVIDFEAEAVAGSNLTGSGL